MRFSFCTLLVWLSLCCPPVLIGQDPFAAGVRTTPWLKPEEEQKSFKLAPGFEIELIAAEPQIQKPLNMAFDDRNRLWLTDSVEYPYAAPLDKPGRDSIKILEDTDGDGKFDKITTFADGLNIPIGIYPWRNGCIAWSIPYLWHLEDTDHDGKCDRRTKLYGPFDHTRDTHGNINSLRRGWDGWLYSNHGFNNQSQVKGSDGHAVTMHSGNTFRVRMDGTRIEHFTHGQVNPFGSSFDHLFNIFTADCHSKPLTQLLRGAYYPSFGRPHDGLGFVPSMMEHSHGSTAICGVAVVENENFPAEYQGQILSGNVMTCRLNRNSFVYHGSTIQAKEESDFLSCNDPWFRPVDLQIGPDGALYIADFYNRIIGHYEVPLPHPGRDRTSGRLWRVVYRGDAAGTKPAKMPPPLAEMPANKLIEACAHPTLNYRLRAMELLVDHACSSCPEEMAAALPKATPRQKTHLLWGLERMGKLTAEQLSASVNDAEREVRVHAMKILSERTEWDAADGQLAIAGLKDRDGFVARAAADAIGRHPHPDAVPVLRETMQQSSPADNHLRQVLRMAIRDQLAAADDLTKLLPAKLSEAEGAEMVQLVSSIKTLAATRYLAGQIATHPLPEATIFAISQTVSAQAPPAETAQLIGQLRERFRDNVDAQLSLIDMVHKGLQQAGNQEPAFGSLLKWANEITAQGLTGKDASLAWQHDLIPGKPHRENPWVVQSRNSADGDSQGLFFGSLPLGEQKTGIYRSSPFPLPTKLAFFVAGHSGQANAKNEKNFIRLRDAETNELIQESRPPWHDVARKIEWDLQKHAGKKGIVELVDGDEGNAYAWLAVGRFSYAALNPSAAVARQRKSAEIVGLLKLKDRQQDLAQLAITKTDVATQTAAIQAVLALRPHRVLSALAAIVGDSSVHERLRERIATAVINPDEELIPQLLKDVLRQVPARLQTTIADGLASDVQAAGMLLDLIESGNAPATLLQLPAITTKLQRLQNDSWNARVQKLVAALPSTQVATEQLLTERRKLQEQAKLDLPRGEELFKKNCAICHQVGGQGAIVGPQLDGIGLRGMERVLEDVLDPNRNVDVAFRTTTVALTSGKVLSVLVRREEGATLIAVDQQGKEVQIPKGEIEQQARASLSLMPANVAEIIPANELPHLIGYLLQQRTAIEK